jgi:hypothetical protein
MTGRRNIIIATSAIVVFAAVVGFFITLDVSPQIAYARLFIDAGLVIGLVAVVMAMYRDRVLPTDSVVHALQSLKQGKYKTRITEENQGPLLDIVASVNDLAIALEEHQEKQEEIKRNLREELLPSLKPKEAMVLEHSYHPELGPVLGIAGMEDVKELNEILPKPVVEGMQTEAAHNKLSNILIESKLPQLSSSPRPPERTNFEQQNQDIEELYQRFVNAQKSINLDQIDYSLFVKAIEKTRMELMSSHKCQGIAFDVVSEAEQVALQPKIIR